MMKVMRVKWWWIVKVIGNDEKMTEREGLR